MKRNKLLTLVVVAGLISMLLALLLVACAQPTPAPAPKPAPTPAPAPAPAPKPAPELKYSLTCATNYGTGSCYLAFLDPGSRWESMVEEASGGRLTIDTKVDLVADKDVAVAVTEGRADMGRFHISYVSGTWPLWDTGNIPFVWTSKPAWEAAVKDPRYVKLMEKSYREAGLVPLAYFNCGSLDAVWGNQPIVKLEDFKGLKIRASGILPAETLKLLGASPVTIAGPEIPEAIQRGVIDAALTNDSFGIHIGLDDVCKYVNRWIVSAVFTNALVVNEEKFEALPSDLQRILQDTAQDIAEQVSFTAMADFYTYQTSVQAAGVEVLVPDKEETQKVIDLVRGPVVEKWLETAGPSGPEIISILMEYAK